MTRCAAIGLAAALLAGAAAAQFRTGEPPVVAPPPAPAAEPPLDPVPAFNQAYKQAGQPVVMLLWNRTISDQTQTATEQRQTVTESGRRARSALDKTTAGAGESAKLAEEDSSDERKRTTVSGTYASDDAAAKGAAPPSAAALMLQRAFMAAMQRGGVRFVDRTLALRTTAATTHRGGGDRQLIETDALLKHAELVMEVLPVADKQAPAGHAFDVRTRRVVDGRELVSVYTRAVPELPAQLPGAWVAGKDGYEFRTPPAPPPPTPVQLGQALARDVMLALGHRLEPRAAAAVAK